MVNKKHQSIKLANSIDLTNVDTLLVTGGGVSQYDRKTLVETCQAINPDIKVCMDLQLPCIGINHD
jgi:hypothetical protein